VASPTVTIKVDSDHNASGINADRWVGAERHPFDSGLKGWYLGVKHVYLAYTIAVSWLVSVRVLYNT